MSARVTAADERRAEGDRSASARALADRVAALPPPERAATPPRTPPAPRGASNDPSAGNHKDVVQCGPQSAVPRNDTPRGDGPLVISLRRGDPEPPDFTPDDLAALGRLLNP